MRISLKEFRHRIKEDDLYRWFISEYPNEVLRIPLPSSAKFMLVRSLIRLYWPSIKIREAAKCMFKYIRYVRQTEYSKSEQRFDKFCAHISHKQRFRIARHLVKTCGGCSVYFKHKNLKAKHFIIEKHIEGWILDDIITEFRRASAGKSCTKKYIQSVIRTYEKTVNPLYLPKRIRKT